MSHTTGIKGITSTVCEHRIDHKYYEITSQLFTEIVTFKNYKKGKKILQRKSKAYVTLVYRKMNRNILMEGEYGWDNRK